MRTKILAARGESPAALDQRCIPQGAALDHGSAGSNTPGILARRAWQWPDAAWIQRGLGATRHVHHGLLVLVTGAALLAGAVPVVGHHAFSAEFDADRPLTLQGAVSKTEWINPHSWIHIDVEGEDGQVVTWAIECGAPNSLMRRGLNKNSIPVGTELVIDGFGSKDGSTTANARDITLPDGSTFFVGSSGTGAPYER